MKQKLALSCTLIHTPDLLVLDEPTTGVDPLSRQEFWTILMNWPPPARRCSVSTPYMDETAQCHRVALMHRGRVLASGLPLKSRLGSTRHLLEDHRPDTDIARRLLGYAPQSPE